VATTANVAPGSDATIPVALMTARMLPRRTGSTMTGVASSGSDSRGTERRQAGKAMSAARTTIKAAGTAPTLTGDARFGKLRLFASDRRHDFGEAVEDLLVAFLLI
jgi:hypothetical protein